MTDRELDEMLSRMRTDEVPLSPDLRAAVLGAVAPPPRARRTWPELLGGFVGLPASALAGLWLGLAEPDLVRTILPGTDAVTEDALLADVFGTWEIEA